MSKLIFLDFDGVLNCNSYFNSAEFKQETKGMSDAQIMLISHFAHIDPLRVNLLNKLVDRSGADVIVSTSWRLFYSLETLNDILRIRGATFEIVDKTPNTSSGYSGNRARHFEIQAYLDSLEGITEAFVILDDIKDMGSLSDHLVLTETEDGLTEDLLEKAFDILKDKL